MHTDSGSNARAMAVASAQAGAVSRLAGSAMMFFSAKKGTAAFVDSS